MPTEQFIEYHDPDWVISKPEKLMQIAYHLWEMSGFEKVPTEAECNEHDERYLIELHMIRKLVEHQGRK